MASPEKCEGVDQDQDFSLTAGLMGFHWKIHFYKPKIKWKALASFYHQGTWAATAMFLLTVTEVHMFSRYIVSVIKKYMLSKSMKYDLNCKDRLYDRKFWRKLRSDQNQSFVTSVSVAINY